MLGLQSLYYCVVTVKCGVEVHYTVKKKLQILYVSNLCVLSRYVQYDALRQWPASIGVLVTAWTSSQRVLPHTLWRSSIFLWWSIRHVTGLWTIPTVYYNNISLQISTRWRTDISLKRFQSSGMLHCLSGVQSLMFQRIVVSLSSGSQSPRRVAVPEVTVFFS